MTNFHAEVVVIGAGPSGSHAAFGFAKRGLRVLLLEEHGEVGTPVHCTGVVGKECLERFPDIQTCVWQSLEKIKILSRDGDSFFLPGMKAFVLNRRKLDLFLASKAEKEGATLCLNHKVVSIEPKEDGLQINGVCHGEQFSFSSKLAILATGSKSRLAGRCGLGEPPQFLRGAQVEAEIESLSDVEVYLDEEVSPGSFAWAVPTSKGKAKLGLITLGNASILLNKLFQSNFLKSRIKSIVGKPVVSRIPLGPSPSSVFHRILAVGDAAGQVKTTTGGGIYYGMLGAEVVVSTALKEYKKNDFSPFALEAYHAAWKKMLGIELKAGLYFRNLFRNVSNAQIDQLIQLFKREDLQALVGHYADFDRHSRLIFALAKVPTLRSFILKLLKG
jgi:digeranylgeranylglycerophospholipid reductase